MRTGAVVSVLAVAKCIVIFEKSRGTLIYANTLITNAYVSLYIISPNYYEIIVKTRSLVLFCLLCMIGLASSCFVTCLDIIIIVDEW